MDRLLKAALAAREHAHAPFSRFRVGSALEGTDGAIYTGCNIENASYGLTMCAERVAIFKAMSEGAREFRRIAVAADAPRLTPPCGPCRQLIWEFCGPDCQIVLVNPAGAAETYQIRDLLPGAFDGSFLSQ